MELKTYFAQDLQGNVIPSPTVYIYQPGTTTLATGLQTASGAALSNPFTGTSTGQIQLRAPTGAYDMRIAGAGRDYTIRVQFIDLDQQVAEAQSILNDLKGRWYGALASDPTTDPNGAPVGAGDSYFNTTLNQTRVYSGTAWLAPFNPTDSSAVAFQQAGTGAVATTLQSKLRETVSVKDFGCVCDGVTDDTLNFRKAVNHAMDTGVRLLTLGQLRITDEIEINKTVWISGTGTASPDFGKTESLIKFDNNAVDGSGNATKALFRFTNANLYKVAGCQIENLVVKHIQQTPKSQHTIIIDTLYTEDLQFRNIRVDDATGYIFWMTGSGGNYQPGLHNPTFTNINGRNVGGIFGQSASAKTWIVGADVQQINLEVAINPVSPGAILCDFSGFRVSTFDNFILEGTGAAATTTTIKNTGPLNTYTSIWIEFPTNPQTYTFDTTATVELNGFLSPGKIKASEAETVVTCRGLSADWTSNTDRVELLRGARIVVEQTFSYGYYNVTRPVVPINQAGRVKFRDTPTAAGASYSHDYSRCLFKLDRAKSITVPTSAAPLALNSYVEIETFGTPSILIYPGLSGQEGRVLTVNPYGSDNVPKIRFRVKNLADYYGASLVIGIRYAVSTSDTGSTMRIPEYVSGAAENVTVSNLPNMTHISNVYTRGSGAQNSYISVGQVSGDVVFELANITGATGVHSIVISDIQVWLGNNLPSLDGYSIDPLTWRAADIPGLGYHVAGDVIFNNSGAATNGWRRKTTGSGNTLGTDWIAF